MKPTWAYAGFGAGCEYPGAIARFLCALGEENIGSVVFQTSSFKIFCFIYCADSQMNE